MCHRFRIPQRNIGSAVLGRDNFEMKRTFIIPYLRHRSPREYTIWLGMLAEGLRENVNENVPHVDVRGNVDGPSLGVSQLFLDPRKIKTTMPSNYDLLTKTSFLILFIGFVGVQGFSIDVSVTKSSQTLNSTLTVFNTNNATLNFTITTVGTDGWLSVLPLSGTVPGTADPNAPASSDVNLNFNGTSLSLNSQFSGTLNVTVKGLIVNSIPGKPSSMRSTFSVVKKIKLASRASSQRSSSFDHRFIATATIRDTNNKQRLRSNDIFYSFYRNFLL